jgi:hypothetical protein
VQWSEADAIFHGDPRWIGGDGAYSVDLGGGRVLWLFGDSFVAHDTGRVRERSKMVRNSVALQTGSDPRSAFFRFYWRSTDGEEAQSFLGEEGDQWFWPEHGIRLGSALLLFWERLHVEGEGIFNFDATAWAATVVDTPDSEPSSWNLRRAEVPASSFGIILGEAVLVHEAKLYVYGTRGDFHDLFVARFDVDAAARGDLQTPEWWHDDHWSTSDEPTAIIGGVAPELSIHFDATLGKFVCVHGEGFGGTSIAVRDADRPEGSWSAPRTVFRPPESDAHDAFVYAAKAHPELWAGGDLAVTYVPSTFGAVPREREEQLYYPRFVRVSFR